MPSKDRSPHEPRRVTGPGTIGWFARHELLLAWRDWAWLLSGGHSRHWGFGAVGLAAVVLFMHMLAWIVLSPAAGLTGPPDRHMLAMIGGTLLLYGSLMLSQAIESITRAFYARGDLDLILSSPAAASRLFAVRIGAMTASIMGMALVLVHRLKQKVQAIG